MGDSIRDRRTRYETAGLDVGDLDADPVAQWRRWYEQAEDAAIAEPNAMTLGTVGRDGLPDARVVLCRGADEAGLAFYTNYEGAKSRQLDAAPAASVVFAWLDLHRQVRARGAVEQMSGTESDDYFRSRPRESQIGAWASPQSRVIADRATLEVRVAEVEERFDGREVDRPGFWGGWRVVPTEWEFWQGRPGRLHDRLRYRRAGPDDRVGDGQVRDGWIVERLAP
ncbi:pyridoxamine 5'-phosphate oxidase [Ilumatobacter sp.]|uniref:pyridoxamine 5'-phosphate oxidase n=1 Tax=Ilumatobacter sp. TaxID=1967498 RepID=UPI003B51E8C2